MSRDISAKLKKQRLAIANDVLKCNDRNEVAIKWNCSRGYVDRCCQEVGIYAKKLTQPQFCKVMNDILNTEFTFEEIAKRHKIVASSLTRIHRIMKEAGFQTNRKKGRPRK